MPDAVGTSQKPPVVRAFLKYWGPVLVCVGLIFFASGDRNSYQHSSRLIGPLLRWLFPQMPEATVVGVVAAVRKFAHLAEYAILALLVWRAVRKPVRGDPQPWLWTQAGRILLLVALYAATDELHQHFVPSRQASVVDVLIDTAGAAAGLLALYGVGRWRKLW